jgi:glycosyltransferase involved in cell wall biosynthesis
MNIGALVHGYPPYHNAGAEHMLHAMMKWYRAMGHRCIVVVDSPFYPSSMQDYVLDGVEVYHRRQNRLLDCDFFFTHLDRTNEAVVFSHVTGIPVVHIAHNEMTLGAYAVNPEDGHIVVANSHWVAEKLRETWRKDNILVLHPPVWEADYCCLKTGEDITLANLSIAKGAPIFYDVARMTPDRVFLAVQGSYGPQMAPYLGMTNVDHWPTQTDMRRVYSRTKVIFMPSTYESWGRVAVEAACSGIPCIANDTPGLKEALGENGCFPEAYTPEAWKAALDEVLANYETWQEKAFAVADAQKPEQELAETLSAIIKKLEE